MKTKLDKSVRTMGFGDLFLLVDRQQGLNKGIHVKIKGQTTISNCCLAYSNSDKV
jgi:hypothetical protein